jgi:hypothetical protein
MFFEFPTQDLHSEFSVTAHKEEGPKNATTGPREVTHTNTWKANDGALFSTNSNTCHIQDMFSMSLPDFRNILQMPSGEKTVPCTLQPDLIPFLF